MADEVTLNEVISVDLIACKLNAKDRDDLIQQVGNLMLAQDKIEPEYIDAMKRIIDELGPYVVIAPGIALLHARPEDGVKEVCIALATLEEPIEFGHPTNDPVTIAFGLAASSEKNHILALTTLAKKLAVPGVIEKLNDAQSSEELFGIICSD